MTSKFAEGLALAKAGIDPNYKGIERGDLKDENSDIEALVDVIRYFIKAYGRLEAQSVSGRLTPRITALEKDVEKLEAAYSGLTANYNKVCADRDNLKEQLNGKAAA